MVNGMELTQNSCTRCTEMYFRNEVLSANLVHVRSLSFQQARFFNHKKKGKASRQSDYFLIHISISFKIASCLLTDRIAVFFLSER